MYKNPFTPVFGNEPPILAGRNNLIDDVLRGLDAGVGDPNRITIFTGPRGSGKTVLLAKIANEAQERGWIAVHVPAVTGMLESLKDQIDIHTAELLPRKQKSQMTGLQGAGFGITREIIKHDNLGWRAHIEKTLNLLEEMNVGLLFTIDEVSASVPEMIEFVSTFQVYIMEKRNVALLMAGLPDKVLQMFQDDSISFLRRAFRRKLDPLSNSEARAVIKKTVELSGREIDQAALALVVDSTGGFPFIIQLIGYHTFNQSDSDVISVADAKSGIDSSYVDLESMILDSTMYSLSEMDKKFLLAMVEDEKYSLASDIARRLGVSVNYVGTYRRRLVEQGVITPIGRGKFSFTIPIMRSMLAKMDI
ncbi:MAG: hypothetical protein LBN34_06310 [Clostridiales Family XIII bacterium]|jgi:AAA+ ATPase superfamily predicted ATPase|nr:hypothetical protein [Clostridiales Family XIII bacterium]